MKITTIENIGLIVHVLTCISAIVVVFSSKATNNWTKTVNLISGLSIAFLTLFSQLISNWVQDGKSIEHVADIQRIIVSNESIQQKKINAQHEKALNAIAEISRREFDIDKSLEIAKQEETERELLKNNIADQKYEDNKFALPFFNSANEQFEYFAGEYKKRGYKGTDSCSLLRCWKLSENAQVYFGSNGTPREFTIYSYNSRENEGLKYHFDISRDGSASIACSGSKYDCHLKKKIFNLNDQEGEENFIQDMQKGLHLLFLYGIKSYGFNDR